jgi:sortase A
LTPLKRSLLWLQRALFTGAISLFLYCGFVLTDAWLFQRSASLALEQGSIPVPLVPAAMDAVIGRIEVPRLGLSAIIVEGTTAVNLRHAVGHIVQTGLPGQPKSNIGLAAHRDTFFRPLKDIKLEDTIKLTTPRGEFRYRVVSTRVVPPAEVSVLDPNDREILTLVTCFPFQFVGLAPDRFIVRAERVL